MRSVTLDPANERDLGVAIDIGRPSLPKHISTAFQNLEATSASCPSQRA